MLLSSLSNHLVYLDLFSIIFQQNFTHKAPLHPRLNMYPSTYPFGFLSCNFCLWGWKISVFMKTTVSASQTPGYTVGRHSETKMSNTREGTSFSFSLRRLGNSLCRLSALTIQVLSDAQKTSGCPAPPSLPAVKAKALLTLQKKQSGSIVSYKKLSGALG